MHNTCLVLTAASVMTDMHVCWKACIGSECAASAVCHAGTSKTNRDPTAEPTRIVRDADEEMEMSD